MLINDNQYLSIIDNLKSEIQKSQYSAALAVNSELTMLYYRIGKVINEYKTWGNKFIDNLSRDLKIAFPNSTGYSVRNLKYMAKFAALYADEQIVQEVLAQITWYHNKSPRIMQLSVCFCARTKTISLPSIRYAI